jgi:hypothetical protein
MSGMDKEHYAAWREGYDRGRDEWADARAKGLPSKSELIRRALATNPDQPAASIAREVGCTPALVSLVKKKLERATLAADKEALEARVREVEAALIQERLENLWNAYNTGHEKDGQWTHAFMSDGEWLASECGLDPRKGWYDATEVKRLIPEAARAAPKREEGE